MAEIENLNLSGLEHHYRASGPAHGSHLAELIYRVRRKGKWAAHPSIGRINENPRRWEEKRALYTIRTAKRFIEKLAALESRLD
jgi:hypothetical protein